MWNGAKISPGKNQEKARTLGEPVRVGMQRLHNLSKKVGQKSSQAVMPKSRYTGLQAMPNINLGVRLA